MVLVYNALVTATSVFFIFFIFSRGVYILFVKVVKVFWGVK